MVQLKCIEVMEENKENKEQILQEYATHLIKEKGEYNG